MSEPRPEFKKKELALSASPYVYLPVDVPVYTVEVCHREEINGDLLQQALDRTVQRMPYLTDTLVAEETGKVWYAENPLPMQAAHTAELRRVGGRETNYHMLDLTWDENKTWFSMFHGFCDGQGISAFLETVLYYYYCLKDGKTYEPNGIRTDASPMDEGEFQEPLSHPYAIDPGFTMPEKKEQPALYHLPEFSPTRDTSFRVYSLRVSSGEMMDFVRKNGTSPSVMFSMLMGEAILRVHPEADAPVMANVPVSLRKMLGCEETFKNCSGRIILPIHGTPMDAMPFAERAAALRGLLKMQMNPNIHRMTYNYLGNLYRQRMENAVSYAEEIKKPAGFMNISHDTFYTDYIGSFHQTGYSDQITDVHFLCKPPMGSVPHMNIIEHDGQFRMEILACCDFTAYAEAMAEAMKGFGLSVTTMPEWSFLTPLTNWREGMQITA
jgi:hypothetical protein